MNPCGAGVSPAICGFGLSFGYGLALKNNMGQARRLHHKK
jgi:hypothetical protein